VSLGLSAGLNLQDRSWNCRARKHFRSRERSLSMRARDPDRQRDLSQLEKERPGRAQLRPGADGIVRYVVLSGRNQDRRAADHRLVVQAWLRRQVWNSVAG